MPQIKLRVYLRPATVKDADAFLEAACRSRTLHRGKVSPPVTRAAYRAWINRGGPETHRRFLVVRRDREELVGVITVNHIIRGPLQSAFVGYYAFADHAGQGLMREGMQLVVAHAFRKLKLHRLEANIQPGNRASVAFARQCGFVREGFSRKYLKVAGRWRDHERWAILSGSLRG